MKQLGNKIMIKERSKMKSLLIKIRNKIKKIALR